MVLVAPEELAFDTATLDGVFEPRERVVGIGLRRAAKMRSLWSKRKGHGESLEADRQRYGWEEKYRVCVCVCGRQAHLGSVYACHADMDRLFF